MIARPEGRVYFGNAARVLEKLHILTLAASPRVLLLDGSAIPGLEYTSLKMLVEAEERLGAAGVELWLASLNPETLDLVRRTPLAERLGRERMYQTVEQAVAAFEARQPAAGRTV